MSNNNTIPAVNSKPDPFHTATTKSVFQHEYSVASVIVTLSVALSLYNSLEMTLLISTTFKKWKGLYFWSISLCTLGVIMYNFGIMLGYFELCIRWFWNAILDIGWTIMLTSQSFVLYSRLHLLVDNPKLLTSIKWVIIFNGVVLCTLVCTFDFGNSYARTWAFAKGYYYLEQIQLIIFTVQEMGLSGIYLWRTAALLKIISKDKTRAMMYQLLFINVIIVLMDVAIVALQFLHFQLYQESIKGFVYSVKLKLELNILSKLVDVVHGNARDRNMTLDYVDSGASLGGQVSRVRRSDLDGIDPMEAGSVSREKPSGKVAETGLGSGSSFGSSSSRPDASDDDAITKVFSNTSRRSARNLGRESDLMYADMLRSM